MSLGTFAIFGSGPLAVRGLKEPNDLDIIVTQSVYEEFRDIKNWTEKLFLDGSKHYLEKENIELWKEWGPGEWNVQELINTAEIIEGLPYVNLHNVLLWKEQNARPKDLEDILKIKEYLAGS